jgi:hypothetical protein
MGVELLSGLLLLHAGDLGAEVYAPPPNLIRLACKDRSRCRITLGFASGTPASSGPVLKVLQLQHQHDMVLISFTTTKEDL